MGQQEAPNFDFGDWWSKEQHHRGGGSPVVVKMENSNYSLLEIESPNNNLEATKASKGKNARQLTWVLLLRAHKAAGCIAWAASGTLLLLAAIRNRLIGTHGTHATHQRSPRTLFFKTITVFLIFALVMLCVEAAAHAFGWPSQRWNPSALRIRDVPNAVYAAWIRLRAEYIAPPLQRLTSFCIWLFLLQSVDLTVLTVLGYVWIKWKGLKPVPVNASLASDDVEDPDGGHPMVLVQIPMCNEREVYEQSIAAVCQLDWPSSRILIQVLDDSSDVETRFLIKGEVAKWRDKCVNIVYRHRADRTGYKAGNLKSAMQCDYVKAYEFVTIFDADFQPTPDFLKRTVPHFRDNPELALVQARWSFVNKTENLLTRLQNMNLTFHFEVEQQVNGIFLNFFGFNGTAGVWRIQALEESGGWLERTTVEDMDIAVRAHLQGWKFIFLNDVRCLCELPGSYEAYRKQQHRWHSGPMQLFRLSISDIIKAKISWTKKANLIFLFFLLRKLILPFYSFTLFCIILPMVMFVPEATLPLWVVCYIPMFMSFLKVLPSPHSFPFLIPYLLFENTMSVTKFHAMISGLFELSSSHEWVVTKKTGRASHEPENYDDDENDDDEAAAPHQGLEKTTSVTGLDALDVKLKPLVPPVNHHHQQKQNKKKKNRLYRKELLLAFLLLAASARSLLSAHGLHFYFLLFQGVSFLVVGLDLIGEQVS